MNKPAPTTPLLRASASSRLEDGVEADPGEDLVRGGRQQLELERETGESEPWDSSSDGDGQGADLLARTLSIDGIAAPGGAGAGEGSATRGRGGKQKQLDAPAATSLASAEYGRAGEAGGRSSAGSNPNVSSPTRPAEEGSDWDVDGSAGQSSEDAESDSESDGRRQTPYSSCQPRVSKDAAAPAAAADAAAAAAHGIEICSTASGGEHLAAKPCSPSRPPLPVFPSGAGSPVSELGPGSGGAAPTTGENDETGLVGGGTLPAEHNHHRPPSPSRSRHSSGESRPGADKPTGNTSEDDTTTRQGRASNDEGGGGCGGDDEVKNIAATHDSRGASGRRKTSTSPETRSSLEPLEADGRAAGKETAVVEALRAELSTLRDHVFRSERKREAQLRELVARLDAQEKRRNDSCPARGPAGSALAIHASAPPGEGGSDEAVRTGRTGRLCRDGRGGGLVTPHGGAVRNPFAAGTGGGAAMTPRDHFPAFEDALLDDGDRDEGALRGSRDRGGGGGGEDDEEGNKSALHQSEAFDFSIDTLSHINNHTDFGTDAPVATAAAPPAATATTSPKIGADGRGGGRWQRESPRLPWVVGAPSALDTGGRLKGGQEEGGEEDDVFDAKDAAAEEAFFSDACATASLQTPVKHLLATAAASDPGVAVRRGRTSCANASTPARRRPTAPPSSSDGEQGQEPQRERQHVVDGAAPVGRPPHGRESVQSSCGGRALPVPLDSPQSPRLCMADFFARASAELEGGVADGGGGGGQGAPGPDFSAAAEPSAAAAAAWESSTRAPIPPAVAEEKPRSVRVDAACQTTLSFSVHDEVRFVSIPPLVRKVDGGVCGGEDEADGGLEWSSLGRRSERNAEKGLSSGAALGPAACAAGGGELFCGRLVGVFGLAESD